MGAEQSNTIIDETPSSNPFMRRHASLRLSRGSVFASYVKEAKIPKCDCSGPRNTTKDGVARNPNRNNERLSQSIEMLNDTDLSILSERSVNSEESDGSLPMGSAR